jgi:hypothetical protein
LFLGRKVFWFSYLGCFRIWHEFGFKLIKHQIKLTGGNYVTHNRYNGYFKHDGTCIHNNQRYEGSHSQGKWKKIVIPFGV